MKNPLILALAFAICAPTFAQLVYDEGDWDCLYTFANDPVNIVCRPACPENGATVVPDVFECPDSNRQDIGHRTEFECYQLANATVGPPKCIYPNPTTTMTVTVDSGDNGGGTGKGAAFGAAGAFAVVALWNWLGPDLPEEVEFRPSANYAFRDGVGFASAGVQGSWRNWEFSANSGNAGYGWTKPYMRVQWSWAF